MTDDRPDPPERGTGAIDLDAYPSMADREPLLDLPNVTGHAIGYREVDGERTADIVVRVIVEQKVPRDQLADDEVVPRVFDGVPTDVVEGHDEPDNVKGNRDSSYQPVPAGVSASARQASGPGGTGSFGGWFSHASGTVGITASHLFDNQFTEDATGRTISHPGYGDRVIGTVTHTEPFSSTNFCDTVYFEPASIDDVSPRAFGLGEIRDTISPTLGYRITNTGWRTGLTSGEVVSINGTATFNGQTVHGVFETDQGSGGGNSGGLVGWVTPKGDILAAGILVGSRVRDNVRTSLNVALDHMAQTAGLGPLTAPTNEAPHPPVSGGTQYIEGGVTTTRWNEAAGTYDVDIRVVNTGGVAGTTSVNVYETTNGYTAIAARTVQRDPLEAGIETFTINDEYGHQTLVIATNDQVDAFAADDVLLANADWLGYTIRETPQPAWATDTVVTVDTTPDVTMGTTPAGVSSQTRSTVLPETVRGTATATPISGVKTREPLPGDDFTGPQPVKAPGYGEGGYGGGAYGEDFDPGVTPSGWELPRRGDSPEVYHAKVRAIAEHIDQRVAGKGPVAERPAPDPTLAGRIWIVTDDDDGTVNRPYMDTGTRWEAVDLDIALDTELLTLADQPETITGFWQFLQRIDADISGHATGTAYALDATAAVDSEALDGDPVDEYTHHDATAQQVEGNWRFERRVRAANTTSRLLGGAVTLPHYRDPDAR